MSPGARQQLWLAAWVIGFAVAMSCLLLVFKHRAAIDHLQRERLQLVASGIGDTVERSLTLGITFTGMEALPGVMRSQKAADPLIAAIDVADAAGSIVYSTEAARIGGATEPALREAMSRAKGETWHARVGSDASEGAIVRNSFGLVLGHVAVRYRLDGLDEASRAFARHLAVWGAAIAAACTLLLFAMLRFLHARLERKLEGLRALLLHPASAAPGDPLAADALAARDNIREAGKRLDAAAAALALAQKSRETRA